MCLLLSSPQINNHYFSKPAPRLGKWNLGWTENTNYLKNAWPSWHCCSRSEFDNNPFFSPKSMLYWQAHQKLTVCTISCLLESEKIYIVQIFWSWEQFFFQEINVITFLQQQMNCTVQQVYSHTCPLREMISHSSWGVSLKPSSFGRDALYSHLDRAIGNLSLCVEKGSRVFVSLKCVMLIRMHCCWQWCKGHLNDAWANGTGVADVCFCGTT